MDRRFFAGRVLGLLGAPFAWMLGRSSGATDPDTVTVLWLAKKTLSELEGKCFPEQMYRYDTESEPDEPRLVEAGWRSVEPAFCLYYVPQREKWYCTFRFPDEYAICDHDGCLWAEGVTALGAVRNARKKALERAIPEDAPPEQIEAVLRNQARTQVGDGA